MPSHEDDFVTKSIYKALHAVGIELEDHIIVVDEKYFSFAHEGFMGMMRY